MNKKTRGTVARSTSTPCVTHEHIKKLFAILHVRYGPKWSSQVPADMAKLQIEQWQRILSKFTPLDIKRGLDTWAEDWPPNVFEFERVCRPPPTGCFGILEDEQRRLSKKPKQTISKEQAKKNTDQLLDIIHGAQIYSEDKP